MSETDLFGEARTEAQKKMPAPQRTTCFGAGLDALARREGGWPDNYVVYLLEAVSPKQVLMEGDAPNGWKRDGWLKFPTKKEGARPRRVVVSQQAYEQSLSPQAPVED